MHGRKAPRDFVHVDELWQADEGWASYFIGGRVWVFADEYRAELSGDEDYSRILVQAGDDRSWIYTRPLAKKAEVAKTLDAIERPVSEKQLARIGFALRE